MWVRVVLQERRRLVRDGLASLLDANPGIQVAAAVATASELVAASKQERPDVVLLEATMTDWDVPRLIATLRKSKRSLRVYGLARGALPIEPARLRGWGMRAVFDRDTGIAPIVAAITTPGPRQPAPAVTPLLNGEASRRPAAHTGRELEVLRLVAAGEGTSSISDRLDISPKTVENHKQRIFGKLGVQNQAHAVSVAMRSGALRADLALEA